MIYMQFLKKPSHKIFSNILIGKHDVVTMVMPKVNLHCPIVKGIVFMNNRN